MPKLTRLAGFELGSGFYMNPTPPEDAARFLRGATGSLVAARASTVAEADPGGGAQPGALPR
jgi:hypothetical protein